MSNGIGSGGGRGEGKGGRGGGGAGGGEGGLALRIAYIFVVLIMNEKRNECSESCRQANFSVLSSNIVGVTARFFFFAQLYQLYFD